MQRTEIKGQIDELVPQLSAENLRRTIHFSHVLLALQAMEARSSQTPKLFNPVDCVKKLRLSTTNYLVNGIAAKEFHLSVLPLDKRLTNEQAMQEINGLNPFQLICLHLFYAKGLKAAEIRTLAPESCCSDFYTKLEDLIHVHNISPAEAINQLISVHGMAQSPTRR